jgi:hypothetical protein
VSKLSDWASDADSDDWGPIGCEHADGTLTDRDGEPLPEDAEPVVIVSWDVSQTWP